MVESFVSKAKETVFFKMWFLVATIMMLIIIGSYLKGLFRDMVLGIAILYYSSVILVFFIDYIKTIKRYTFINVTKVIFWGIVCVTAIGAAVFFLLNDGTDKKTYNNISIYQVERKTTIKSQA